MRNQQEQQDAHKAENQPEQLVEEDFLHKMEDQIDNSLKNDNEAIVKRISLLYRPLKQQPSNIPPTG